jgi:predicted PurR-regulated permease PerM
MLKMKTNKSGEERSPFWWLRWVPAALAFLLVLELIYIVGRVAIVPVLASFAIAYLLEPIVEYFEQYRLKRPIAAILSILLVSVVLGGVLALTIPDLWAQATAAGEKIMAYATPGNAAWQRAQLREFSPFLDAVIGEKLERIIRDPAGSLSASASWAAGGLSDFFSTAVAGLDLLVVPFFVFYILVDFQTWRDSSEELIPPRFREPFSRMFDEVGRILQSYVRGQLMIAMIMAALYAAGFVFLGVPAWGGIAVISGFLNLIPYVGTLFGWVLAGGFTFADTRDLWRVFAVTGVFVVVQTIEGYYLTPKILGGRLRLHPMAVFLGLLIGGKLFGFLGILLAVPVIAICHVFLKFFRELYKASKFYHKGELPPEEAPSENIEERIAEAAETVLTEQVEAQEGDELLAPEKKDDDPVARELTTK